MIRFPPGSSQKVFVGGKKEHVFSSRRQGMESRFAIGFPYSTGVIRSVVVLHMGLGSQKM